MCLFSLQMFIHGKVKYNLGVLMLASENVQFIGGSVETLGQQNKLEALLQKQLQVF